ncbi:mediator of RNA polymerase II transcription subunit 8 isoform X2 [Ananas comosus]|uniref:Mediator of RNA polymerase II transcription subunit 8 isoform X2 n=1 Tax=Ananas comosus TaxID=4615 RepID=A0A6P5GUT4_ANACO|nr:mediator of RNA polymerase II transcription subunit 8 isoform X2 [Ananas comosus]
MEMGGGAAPPQGQQQPPPGAAAEAAAAPRPAAERLNAAVVQQLNLESVKTRALGLDKAISRILGDFDAYARANSSPKWQDVIGQFSMVSMELFNIVEDIKKVSKAFAVYPRNVSAENAAILPVMLSSKLLPEMEAEDNTKREQLLYGITNLPIHTQIEKLKARIDMIGSACEAAEKVIADCRKAYGLASRQGPSLVPTLDKVQAAKIQEQENLLRAAVNFGEGLRMPGDQRQLPSSLPSHLVDVLSFGDNTQNFGDNSGVYSKNTPAFTSNAVNNQGTPIQAPGAQQIGRSAPSPSGVSGTGNFDNASTPPMPYANSPRSSTNMMNTPSPQQQLQQQLQQQQQQRQKMMQVPSQHQQQLHSQQQLRPSSTPGVLGQSTMSQLHDLQGQAQQKLQQLPGQHQMQYSQSLSQHFQNRQMQSMQQNMAQNQLNQGSQLRSHLSQFTGAGNNALLNAAQASPNSQMISNISTAMQSQSFLPRMQQFGLNGGHPQRNHASQMLNDQMFGMGASNPSSMVGMQQQQQSVFGNMQTNVQNLQPGMVTLPNPTQNPNFPQQRQQNQQ